MTSLKLHWAIGSQPGRAVKTVLDIGKIPCTLINVDTMQRQQRQDKYLKMYAPGKMPVLQQDDFTLGQSGAIMIYLCELYPQIGYLRGQNIEQRTIINQYVSWYQSYFRLALFKPIRLYLGAIFTQKPLLLAQKDTLFQEMFDAIGKFDELLCLRKSKFMTGDRLSIADLLFFYEMTNLISFKLSFDKFSYIKRWYQLVENIAEVNAVMKEWHEKAGGLASLFDNVEIVKAKL